MDITPRSILHQTDLSELVVPITSVLAQVVTSLSTAYLASYIIPGYVVDWEALPFLKVTTRVKADKLYLSNINNFKTTFYITIMFVRIIVDIYFLSSFS